MPPAAMIPEIVAAGLAAGAKWVTEREFPDPVGWTDLAHSPSDATLVLESRRRREPVHWARIQVRKDSAQGYRPFWIGDPYEEALLRISMNGIVDLVDRALGGEVMSYRLKSGSPGWAMHDHWYPHGVSKEVARLHAESPVFGGYLRFDVRSYFPTFSVELADELLARLGVPSAVGYPLIGRLTMLQDVTGIHGIPTGPEASAVLGNLGLLLVDEALRKGGLDFTRYVDDFQGLLVRGQSPEEMLTVVTTALSVGGQTLNSDKTELVSTPHLVARVLDDPVLKRISLVEQNDPARAIELVVGVLELEVEYARLGQSGRHHGRRVRYCFRKLQGAGDSRAVALLVDSPELRELSPHVWRTYLAEMWKRHALAEETLLGLIEQSRGNESVLYNLLSAAASGPMMSEAAANVFEGLITESEHAIPTRCSAAEAWSCSRKWSPRKALRLAAEVGSPALQRALVLSTRSKASGSRDLRAVRKARGISEEAAVAARWVADLSAN